MWPGMTEGPRFCDSARCRLNPKKSIWPLTTFFGQLVFCGQVTKFVTRSHFFYQASFVRRRFPRAFSSCFCQLGHQSARSFDLSWRCSSSSWSPRSWSWQSSGRRSSFSRRTVKRAWWFCHFEKNTPYYVHLRWRSPIQMFVKDGRTASRSRLRPCQFVSRVASPMPPITMKSWSTELAATKNESFYVSAGVWDDRL